MKIIKSEAKFGLFVYNDTNNLGDEIQSLAALQYISGKWIPVDRDNIGGSNYNLSSIKIIGNGWYLHNVNKWPPPDDANILLTSIHLSKYAGRGTDHRLVRDVILSKENINFLKDREPIGARDTDTLTVLQECGINSYFSGCLTMTLQKRNVDRDPDLIVVNDIPQVAIELIRERIRSYKKILILSNYEQENASQNRKFELSEKLLDIYSRASLVVTSRLHTALPCLAYETPVLVIDIAEDRERFSGLENFYRHVNLKDFFCGQNIDFNDPEGNSQCFRIFANELRDRVKNYVSS